MNGILIAAHGSRVVKTLETLETVVNMVKIKLPETIIEVGYMEFCEVDIVGGLNLLKNQGVKSIKVIPYFLFEGIHIRMDIPEEIKKFTDENPGISVSFGNTLGTDERLADILVDRIKEI